MCVTWDGRNEFEDLMLAARNAVDAMLDHLGHEYAYTRQQAYAIWSVAVNLRWWRRSQRSWCGAI